jgi:hypothetical protein
MAPAADPQVIERSYYVCGGSVVYERRGRMLLYEDQLCLCHGRVTAERRRSRRRSA